MLSVAKWREFTPIDVLNWSSMDWCTYTSRTILNQVFIYSTTNNWTAMQKLQIYMLLTSLQHFNKNIIIVTALIKHITAFRAVIYFHFIHTCIQMLACVFFAYTYIYIYITCNTSTTNIDGFHRWSHLNEYRWMMRDYYDRDINDFQTIVVSDININWMYE